jgi:hypothetical protein
MSRDDSSNVIDSEASCWTIEDFENATVLYNRVVPVSVKETNTNSEKNEKLSIRISLSLNNEKHNKASSSHQCLCVSFFICSLAFHSSYYLFSIPCYVAGA